MNNFRIYFKETTTLSIDGNKITFNKGKSVAFRDISNKDTKEIKKKCIKESNMIFKDTSDTLGVYKVIYGAKNKGSKKVEDTIKQLKGNKKDKFKNYIPKQDNTKTINLGEEGVKITQNSLTEQLEKEIIDTEVKIDEEL